MEPLTPYGLRTSSQLMVDIIYLLFQRAMFRTGSVRLFLDQDIVRA